MEEERCDGSWDCWDDGGHDLGGCEMEAEEDVLASRARDCWLVGVMVGVFVCCRRRFS